MSFPVIRLEVEGLKYSIMAALTEHAEQMDSDIKAAVEAYCTPENLAAVVRVAAHKQLHKAIVAEVENFFWSGDGRKAVAEAVKESILQNKTYTPMDDVSEP